MAKVFIIILNWNGLHDTLECLDSVYGLDYPSFEVMVVDNGSSDDSVETIHSNFPQVVLIENKQNLGYTGGNNVGMRYALEHGADYVWLLNNDTVVDPDALAKLVDEAELSQEVGLVSPVIHFYESPEEVQFMGAYVDLLKFKISHICDQTELDCKIVQRNLTLWGTALLIKRSVVETVGFLSEKYFAYSEDCDYSLRALKQNFCAKIRLDARIFHKDSRSTGKQSPIQTFLRTRNTFFLWKDNMPWPRKFLLPGYYMGAVINSAKILSDEGNEKSFDACLDGFWAALNGRGGTYDLKFAIPSWLRIVFKFFVTWHPYFWVNLFKFNFRGIAMDISKKLNILA
jgi:hypothetical protein